MSYKKYADDFRLELRERPGKRAKTVAVYYGPRFEFCAEARDLRRLQLRLPILAFSAAAAFVGSLFLNGAIPRQIYVMLPWFCSFLPHCYLCAAVLGFLTRREFFTREQNDHIPRRIGRCAPALCVLGAYSFLAGIVTLVLGRASLSPLPDIAFLAACAWQTVSSAIIWRRLSPLLQTRETENPNCRNLTDE